MALDTVSAIVTVPDSTPDRGGAGGVMERMGERVELVWGGKYWRGAFRGISFSAIIENVAPGTTATTAPPLTIHNPAGSGKIARLTNFFCGPYSGTLGSGSMRLGFVVQAAAPTGGAAITPTRADLTANRGTINAYSGSTIAAAYTAVAPLLSLGANIGPNQIDFDGQVYLMPGNAAVFEAIAGAGTTPKVTMSCGWEELPFIA